MNPTAKAAARTTVAAARWMAREAASAFVAGNAARFTEDTRTLRGPSLRAYVTEYYRLIPTPALQERAPTTGSLVGALKGWGR